MPTDTTTRTRNLRCTCGSMVRCRPNRNGVVLCPRCSAAYVPSQFRSAAPPREIVHDYTRR